MSNELSQKSLKSGTVEDQSLFRQITPTHFKAIGAESPVLYLKKHAVLLFQKDFDNNGCDVNLDKFTVSLTYKETDGH